MKKQTNIDWLFFDVGGVLLDNSQFENWRNDRILSAVRRFNPAITATDVLLTLQQASAIKGNLEQSAIGILIPNEADREKANQWMRERWEKEIDYLEQSPIRPDALLTVSELSENYRLGIIANQPSEVKAKLDQGGLLGFFSHAGISADYDLHKPDPQIFKIVLQETGAVPARSAMIDDNIERGLLPAKQLGMKTVWFKLSEREASDIDWTISSLSDLLTIF